MKQRQIARALAALVVAGGLVAGMPVAQAQAAAEEQGFTMPSGLQIATSEPRFLTWDDIRSQIDNLKAQYPKLVHESSMGKTAQGNDIVVIRISPDAKVTEKPEALILSGTHPREQQPQVMTMQLMHDMLRGYGKDPYITKLINERQIWFVPALNVDGKIYDMTDWAGGSTKARNWRKNRGKPNAVDLNRNFAVEWGGASEKVKSETYQGPRPMSEPETQALARFLEERPIRVFFDIHSYMRKLLPPAQMSPAEKVRFDKLTKLLQSKQKEPYQASDVQAGDDDIEGGRTGVIRAYAYYTKGIYAYTFEVVPKTFYPTASEIYTEYERNTRDLMLAYIDEAANLPVMKPGAVKLLRAEVARDPVNEKQIVWKPFVQGEVEWAVVVSDSPDVIVKSPFRLAPLEQGFTLELKPNATPGTSVPLKLYVWDGQHRRTVIQHTLTVD